MATIHQAVFTASWTTAYPSLLAAGNGRLTTRTRFMSVFDSGDAALVLPWETGQGGPRWSRFWSSYLGTPRKLRQLSADSAWERLIPFQVRHQVAISGPAGTSVEARVLLYPSAVAVTISVRADGSWPLDQLTSSLAALRTGKDWSATQSEQPNRTLYGIACGLRDQAAALLAADGEPGDLPEPGPETFRSVAAPTAGDGDLASLDLGDLTARSCLAGLAVLGPPGMLDNSRLLGANSDSNLAGRCYVLKKGHAIWHPAHVLQPPTNDPIGCLVRNQTDAVVHIAALEGVVSWVADRIAAGIGVPVEVQPLLKLAALRLRQLHTGDSRKTYRSGVAMARVQPLLDTLAAVEGAL